jgi:RNA polymerase sigma factor (sigma-70 family)
MKTDAEDLRSFASHGDQAAFRRIVERHAPMVHGVAWRRMQNRGMAEDVTQNVFIVLARKARFIPHHELAGWLYRTAYMETLNASRKEAVQRSAIEHLTAMTHPPAPAPPEWTGISPHLDEVISQLPPADRQLVVMRYFEQRNYREICQTTGHSEPAVRKRMQRALDRLGVLLKRRGVTTSGTALGAVLTVQTLCTPPASAALIATVALNAMPATAGGVSLFTTLYLMTTQSALKTAAVALVLAAIPTAIYLGNRDAAPAAASSSAKSSTSAATDTASTSRTDSGFNPGLDGRDAPRKVRPDRPAAASGKQDEELTISAKNIFDHIEMAGMTQKDNTRLSNRLTRRLNLSSDQQAKLSAYLEQQSREKSEELKKMLSGEDIKISARSLAAGAAADVGFDANTSSSVASLQVAGLVGSSTDSALNDFLGSILTPEQQATNNAYVEEERQDAAHRVAQELVDDFSRYVDLTPAQKDQLYDQASHHSSTAGDDNASDPVEAAKQLLTPEQLAIYDAGKQEDQAGAPGIATGQTFIQTRSSGGIQTILSLPAGGK